MSEGFHISFTWLTVAIIGVAMMVIGGLLAYYAFIVDWLLAARVLTPIGVFIALLGLLVATSKEG